MNVKSIFSDEYILIEFINKFTIFSIDWLNIEF